MEKMASLVRLRLSAIVYWRREAGLRWYGDQRQAIVKKEHGESGVEVVTPDELVRV